MGTKKIGGIGRDFSWNQFNPRGLVSVEIEDVDDQAHIELSGSLTYSDTGSFTTGVIDLRGSADQLTWNETVSGSMSISIDARFLNTQPILNDDGTTWFNKQLPSNADPEWGYCWQNPEQLSGIQEPYQAIELITNFNTLLPAGGSSTYAVALSTDPYGYFWYSADSGANWTKSGSPRTYFASQDIYTGNIEIITGCLSRFSAGSVYLLANTQLLGTRIFHSNNAAGSTWTDSTDEAETVLQAPLSPHALLASYILPNAQYTNVLVARSKNGTGFILDDRGGIAWGSRLSSSKLLDPIQIGFASPKYGGYIYLGSIYETDRGWKSAYFRGMLQSNTTFTWEELSYAGESHVTEGKENASCGIQVVNINGVETVIALSASGSLFNMQTNSIIDTLPNLVGGRLSVSRDMTRAIIYSTVVTSLSSCYLFEPIYLRCLPTKPLIQDEFQSVLQVSDLGSTTYTNWRLLGAKDTSAPSIFNWELRNDFVNYNSGDTVTNGRFCQIIANLTGE